jgi:flagellar protein FliO/FliZ
LQWPIIGVTFPRSLFSMIPLKLTSGAVLGGALMLVHAPAALAASGVTTPVAASGVTTPVAASGENTPLHLTSSPTTHVAAAGAGSGILRTVIGLVIVVALIYGVAWVLKRVKRQGGNASGNGLTQLASLPLGAGRSIALIRAGREVVLVGIAEHGVTPIRTYTEAEVIAGGIDLPEDQAPDRQSADDRAPGLLHLLRRMTVRS